MAGVMNGIAAGILNAYNFMNSALPPWAQSFINLFLLVLVVVIYSILIWRFYKFISKKNPLGLNLNKYNKVEHSFFSRVLTGVLYFVEYILILPFFVFIVFSVFTFFLIILTQNPNISQILIISAVIIAAIRMTSYYKEELSQDLAKMLPLMLLAVAALNPNTFSQSEYIATILSGLSQIPNFIGEIRFYLLFIIILEIIMRFFDYVFSLLDMESPEIPEDESDDE